MSDRVTAPDLFVLSTESAAWVEWKTEAQVQKLSEKYPTPDIYVMIVLDPLSYVQACATN